MNRPTKKKKRRIRRQFSMAFLIAIVTVSALPFAYWSANRKHVDAIGVLQGLDGIELTFSRKNPSWLDRTLGNWRFDQVKRIEVDNFESPSQTYGEAVGQLRHLEEFCFADRWQAAMEPGDIDFLEPHIHTIKSLELRGCDVQPPLLSKFTCLEILEVQSPVDFATLKSPESLKSVGVRWATPKNIFMCSRLKSLHLFKATISPEFIGKELEPLESLSSLDLHDLLEEVDLDAVAKAVPQLSALRVSSGNVKNVASIEQLKQLRSLNIYAADYMPRLSKLPNLLFCQVHGDQQNLEWALDCKRLRFLHFTYGAHGFQRSPVNPPPPPDPLRIDLAFAATLPGLETLLLSNAIAEFDSIPKIGNLRFITGVTPEQHKQLKSRNKNLSDVTGQNKTEFSDYYIELLGQIEAEKRGE